MARTLVFLPKGGNEVWAAIRDDAGPFSVCLGRGRQCEVTLPDHVKEGWTVSRVHARFFRHGVDYWLEDLHSKNLTYANGKVILSPTKVEVPCELRLGSVAMRIERRALSLKELEDCYSPLPATQSLPATQGLEQLGLLDGKSREVLNQVREDLHCAAAIQHVVEVLGDSRRAEEAEVRLQQALEVHFGAQRVYLSLCVTADDLPDVLKEAGIAKQVSAIADRIAAAFANDSNNIQRFETSDPQICVWGAAQPTREKAFLSVVVAQFSKTAECKTSVAAAERIAIPTLRIAAPFIKALNELEERRAKATESVPYKPSGRILKACREAGFWGESSEFTKALYESERAAQSYLKEGEDRLPAVFLLGESGVGKSTLARIMHTLSDHAGGEFIEVNCATIPENLAESELFGHQKGAFTGADSQRKGLFELARNGTLFLDEVGTMGTAVQSKLLSVLDTGTFRPIGGDRTRQTNCFIILATNEDPDALCKKGALREDLWYRIQTLTITIPALRARASDVEVIVRKKLDALNARSSHAAKHASHRVMHLMASYSWPGNVRELVENLDAAFKMSAPDQVEIDADDLPARLREALGVSKAATLKMTASIDTSLPLCENVQRLEREYLVRLLRECDGVKTRTANRASISPQTLYNKLDEFRAWLQMSKKEGHSEEVARLRELTGPFWGMLKCDVE